MRPQSARSKFSRVWGRLDKRLYDVVADPRERRDLARARPGLVQQLRSRVASLLSSLAPPDTPAWSVRGNPQHFNSVWSPGWC